MIKSSDYNPTVDELLLDFLAAIRVMNYLHELEMDQIRGEIDQLSDQINPAAQERRAELQQQLYDLDEAFERVMLIPLVDVEGYLARLVPEYARRLRRKGASNN